MDLISWT